MSEQNSKLTEVRNNILPILLRDLENYKVPAKDRQKAIEQFIPKYLKQFSIQLSESETNQLVQNMIDEVLGFGILQPLLEDPLVTEIMVNGTQPVYVERAGLLSETDIRFNNDDEILRIIDRIVLPLGRRIDSENPTVDARLPDGSRVNAVVPPIAIDGPLLTIRKFAQDKYSIEQLIDMGTMTDHMATFIQACVVSRLNILITGGTGSGKTTMLNAISSFIPEGERIITIEDAAELKLQQKHVARMESKMPSLLDRKGVNMRDLVRNALRMRPDRIVIGEVRGAECLDMLQAMNTGHDGSMTTLHANSPRDAIYRMETMTLMSELDLPVKVIRSQIASAIDVIIHLSRLKGGNRRITYITEISGMEADTVVMSDIFKFEQSGIDRTGAVIGELRPTGIRPLFTTKLEANGFKLSPEVFGANLAEILREQQRM
ncbi:MAG: CpaF family protein [Anaerolineaceae bacterium]|nr:CpaF family protein [Anaerolineaceae bacterium]